MFILVCFPLESCIQEFTFLHVKLKYDFFLMLQARLSFCKFMVQPSTLLVLDEPTNHLDIPTKEMLEVWFLVHSFLA